MRNAFSQVTRSAWLLVLSFLLALAWNAPAQTNDVGNDLRALIVKVQTRLKQLKDQKQNPSAANLASDLQAFDDLLAKHPGEKTDAVGNILMSKALIYLQSLNDTVNGRQTVLRLQRDFPDTAPAKQAGAILAQIDRQEAAQKIRTSLVQGAPAPTFEAKDINGKAISLVDKRGQIVLLSFWASWSTPSVFEIPLLKKNYEDFHAQGFEIIGVSLDYDIQRMKNLVAEKELTWPQCCDGLGVTNKIVLQYGVRALPSNFLIDREGKIIGRDLHGENLTKAVAAALPKK